MEINIDNRRVLIQSFDFSKYGWVNIYVDVYDYLTEKELNVRRNKHERVKRDYPNCPNIPEMDTSLFLGCKVSLKDGQLSFRDYDMKKEWTQYGLMREAIDFFKGFVQKNFEDIKKECLAKQGKETN